MVRKLLSVVELMEQWFTNNFWIGCTDAALHNSAYRRSAKRRQSEAGYSESPMVVFEKSIILCEMLSDIIATKYSAKNALLDLQMVFSIKLPAVPPNGDKWIFFPLFLTTLSLVGISGIWFPLFCTNKISWRVLYQFRQKYQIITFTVISYYTHALSSNISLRFNHSMVF